MSCAFDKERLTAFFDGELDAAERAETERHISGCSECLRDLGEIKSAASAVKTLPRPRAPRSVAEGVAREIAAAGRVRRIDVWRRRVLWGVSAAAAVLILLNVTYFMTPPAPPVVMAKAPASSAAEGLGMLHDKDSGEGRKNLAENSLAESAKKELQAKDGKSDLRQVPADGVEKKDGQAGAPELRRSLKKAEEADRAPAEANRLRAEAKPEAPLAKSDEGARKDATKREAPAPEVPPPAPAAAPPAPARPEAAAAPAAKAKPAMDKSAGEDALRKQADEKRAADADPAAPPRTAGARAALPVVPAYTARGGKASAVRSQAEALARKWSGQEAGAAKAAVASSAPKPSTRSFGALDVAPLVLELTPEQFEELRAELAKADVTLEAGAPESPRGAATGGGLAAPGKEREQAEQKAVEEKAAEPEKLKGGGGAATRRITLYFVESSSQRAKDR